MRMRIATRKSQLALWQAHWVAHQFKKHHPHIAIEFVPFVTEGDKRLEQSLASIGGKGLFIKALEDALLQGKADIAVHSMKDVPYALPEGLVLTCILAREDPADVLLMREPTHLHWKDLPAGARIGTSSVRRQLQLQRLRADFSFQLLRGNVPTRLNRLVQGDYDAIILAQAGLTRLEITHPGYRFPLTEMLPAVGQGAIGIECRASDTHVQTLLAPLNDAATAACLLAERSMSETLQGSCQAPMAGFARMTVDGLELTGRVGDLTSGQMVEAFAKGSDAVALGKTVAASLLAQGAGAWL